MIGTAYGMNFKWIPELDWAFGFPYAIILMIYFGRLAVPLLQAPRLAVASTAALGLETVLARAASVSGGWLLHPAGGGAKG